MEHDRVLGALGLTGLALGLAVTLAGRFGGEFAGLMSGYGFLVILSAAYLLAGLGVRRLVARRTRPSQSPVAVSLERRG
jgi:hypothetical protein